MMLQLGVNGYNADDVAKVLHAEGGSRHVEIICRLLNRENVVIGTMECTGGAVDFISGSAIKRSGRFALKDTRAVDWLNDRIQPVFIVEMPDGGYAEWPLGVFLISSPSRKGAGVDVVMRDVAAYDACVILADDRFDDRYVVKAGINYVSAVNAILIGAGIRYAQVAACADTLQVDCEFEGGTRKLAAVNTLLADINYTDLWADENGMLRAAPYELPFEAESEYSYRCDGRSVVLEDASDDFDLFGVPNKWVVVATNPDAESMMSVYVNDSLTSATSTVRRGRTITQFERINSIASQAALDNYARRMAYESSTVYDTINFRTAAMPHHSYLSNLFFDYPAFGIAAKFQEVSWSLSLNTGEPMRHEARRIIYL